MFLKKKKAISPLIATILLVVVAVAIIGIVLSWGKGFANTSLSSASINVYTESEIGFYLNVQNSINGRSTISYNPPDGTPYNTLNIIGYGLLGYTKNIVPLEPPVTISKSQTANIDHGIILPEVDLVLYLDNNQMITKNKIKQTIKQPSFCPEGYVPVPGNHLYGTMNERGGFCVAKYEMKIDVNGDGIGDLANNFSYVTNSYNVWNWEEYSAGNIVSTPEGSPITYIYHSQAVLACESIGDNFNLITNNEWMTIARNVELISENWSDSIGEGYMPIGNYLDLGNNFAMDGFEELSGIFKRTLVLNNGHKIWDLSGNVFEWLIDDIVVKDHPDAYYDINGSIFTGFSWFEYYKGGIRSAHLDYSNLGNTTLKYKDLFLLTDGKYNSNNGIGDLRINSNSEDISITVFRRGGFWLSPAAGLTSLYLDRPPTNSYSVGIGFRCTY